MENNARNHKFPRPNESFLRAGGKARVDINSLVDGLITECDNRL